MGVRSGADLRLLWTTALPDSLRPALRLWMEQGLEKFHSSMNDGPETTGSAPRGGFKMLKSGPEEEEERGLSC